MLVDGRGVDGVLVEEIGAMCGCVVVEEKGESRVSLGWCCVVRKRLPRRWEVDRRFRMHNIASLNCFHASKAPCLVIDMLDDRSVCQKEMLESSCIAYAIVLVCFGIIKGPLESRSRLFSVERPLPVLRYL